MIRLTPSTGKGKSSRARRHTFSNPAMGGDRRCLDSGRSPVSFCPPSLPSSSLPSPPGQSRRSQFTTTTTTTTTTPQSSEGYIWRARAVQPPPADRPRGTARAHACMHASASANAFLAGVNSVSEASCVDHCKNMRLFRTHYRHKRHASVPEGGPLRWRRCLGLGPHL